MDPTIFWKYAKRISISKVDKLILTGLLIPCSCQKCCCDSSDTKIFIRDEASVYRIGSSNYHLQFKPTYNIEENYYLYSYFNGCPRMEGSIISDLEEVMDGLDQFDKDKVIFNLDLFR